MSRYCLGRGVGRWRGDAFYYVSTFTSSISLTHFSLSAFSPVILQWNTHTLHTPTHNNNNNNNALQYFLLFIFYTFLSCHYSFSFLVYRFFHCIGGSSRTASSSNHHYHHTSASVRCVDHPSDLLPLIGLFIEAMLIGHYYIPLITHHT